MNRTQKASIIKLFPLAVLLASTGVVCNEAEKGGYFRNYENCNKKFSPFNDNKHRARDGWKKEKCKQCVIYEEGNFDKGGKLFAGANF